MDPPPPETSPEHPRMSDRVLMNGTATHLALTQDGSLRWTDEKGQRKELNLEKEVLGFVSEGVKLRIKAIVAGDDVFCCVGGNNEGGALVRKDFVFEPFNLESQKLWCHHLRDYLDSVGRPKRLFIFVNPFGGKKSACKVFLDDVRPLLEDADVQITVQETKYQLHAKEVVSSMDLTKYDGIVCVSGDGILVEVVNGLLSREDWSTAIKMPLGMVPAGTGNGMVKSVLDSVGQPCKPSNAVLAIIRGHKHSLDVATLVQGEIKFFSVLMLAWGLVADIDIESEKYRWMGSARIDFYALQRIFNLRHYNGRISFVPAPGFEDYGEPANYTSETYSSINHCEEQPFRNQQNGYQGPDVELSILDWRAINGPFVSIWLHNVPWGAEDTMAAPEAKFSDGCLDLIIIKECPKMALLSLMTELNTGGHVRSPYVTYLKVKAFKLEPGMRAEDSSKGGIIDVDGEVLARGSGVYKSGQNTLMNYDKLEISVDRGLATVFSPVR